MAYYNPEADQRRKEREKNYKELKKHIVSSVDGLNKWALAHEHMIQLEIDYDKQKKQIEDYQKFFKSLRDLLPKERSGYDTLG